MAKIKTYRFPFAKYPAVRLVLLFSAGIVLNSYIKPAFWVWLLLFLTILPIYTAAEYSTGNRFSRTTYSLMIICYILLITVFGGFWHSLNHQHTDGTAELLDIYTWEDLTFHGEIYRTSKTGSGKYQVDLAVDTTGFGGSGVYTKTYKMRAIIDPAQIDEQIPKLALGKRLAVKSTVYPLKNKSNPHEFDNKKYLASEGIVIQSGVQSIISHYDSGRKFSWSVARQRVLETIERNFSPERQPLAKALLIGYKNDLQRDDKIAFSRAGLSHIMAVSGLHVGFILAPFWVAIPYFWTLRFGKQAGLILLILVLFAYAGITGFSASVCRASLVGCFLMYGRLFHKVRDSKNLTALAALIILLINPDELFTIGFQLSFSAVYIILLTLPAINIILPAWIRFRWYGAPVMIIIISILVQTGLFPLLVYYFGEFSIAGPLVNALVVPFLTIVVPVALLLLPIGMLLPEISQLLNQPIQFFLEYMHEFVQWTSNLPWSWIQTNLPDPLFYLIWLFALFTISAWSIPGLRWKYFCCLLITLNLYQVQILADKFSTPPLRITVFDVGQGDATLVSTPNKRHFLIDTGRWTPNYNSAKYVILPHLKAEGISHLNGIFHSHPHADHIGGTAELIGQISIDTIYTTGISYNSDLYRDFQRKAGTYNIPVTSLTAGDVIDMDPSIRLFTYGPDGNGNQADDVNNNSLILEIIYGSTEFLFMGDAEKKQEQLLVKNYPHLLDTDFLKAGHHGSRTSSNEIFLNTATPDITTVSLAKHNRFGHPNTEAIVKLRQTGSDIFFTSLDGALIFESDGTVIRRKLWK